MLAFKKLMSVGVAVLIWTVASPSEARLGYSTQALESGGRYVIISGAFEFTDDLADFRALVSREHPVFVGFDSPGGNVVKAMEFGRLLRVLGLATIQVRDFECASACSLAFLGGVSRAAEPGSIGVHKSSFSDTSGIPTPDAVSAVQELTADVIGYMMEMGVDPALLQLSLSYDSDDIRYLSKSEMARFRVTTIGHAPATSFAVPAQAPEQRPSQASRAAEAKAQPSLDIPAARTGMVRHPKGKAPIKSSDNPDAKSVGDVANGSAVQILSTTGEWYRVSTAGQAGYMHYSWVRVDQFETRPGDPRFVQVKSFRSLPEAEAFVRQSSVPLAVQLAANGWFAITLKDLYPEQQAKDVANALKAQGSIAKDSMVTLGNTYVREVCCE
jgi:hypothetical protein